MALTTTASRPMPPRGPLARARDRVRALWRDERGTAMTEGVAMLPFMLVVWGCLIFAHEYYSRALALDARDRGCTWQHAANGCAAPPGACAAVDVAPDHIVTAMVLDDGGASVQDFVDLPLIEGLFDPVLARGTRTSSRTHATRPPVLGGGAQALESTARLRCNEADVTLTPEVLSQQMLCGLTGLCAW